MKKYDVAGIREAFTALSQRSNESLGSFDDGSIGIGRFVAGSSPWEKHNNGDELLLVTDGEVQIEVLESPVDSWTELLEEGSLFVVPKGHWHQLTATDNVNILYISPSEDGVERKREHPIHGSAA
ncbi:MAG TPA: cupin domain-containing protein [Pseudomonadales bacterium]|jgi:mannose-6-phosphate isomerase-like protein (cupin superfamily)|nr:cupin domain-containing protein [Pseudomonadales bacterium]|tara:strand:- start:33 stop:407 length:375 start_codon:yes stop_codon:yes gene_type:complete